jgi:hypothetical protein
MDAILEVAIDWDRVLTKDGNTQSSERYYISVIVEQFEKLGAKVGSMAPTQQAIDIRDVEWPDGSVVSYECKKTNSGCQFLFNDTFLKPDVWYIFIYSHLRKVRVASGSSLIEEANHVGVTNIPKTHLKQLGECVLAMLVNEISSDAVKDFFLEVLAFLKSCVIHRVLTYFEFGQLFKQSVAFGSFKSRPRPNWSLTIPYKPSQSTGVEPHSPAEQSDLSLNPPVDTPSEIPESL